jgi:hypothetical protein
VVRDFLFFLSPIQEKNMLLHSHPTAHSLDRAKSPHLYRRPGADFAMAIATMATATESPQRHILSTDGPADQLLTRIVPIPTPKIQMSAPSPGEPMEITTPTSTSVTAPSKSPEPEVNGDRSKNSSPTEPSSTDSMTMPAPPAAAAAVHQPKIVQTAFIHKLYK